ncbi:hypothetical protein AC578_10294 [Pseudocercospora eumusae]|uniref:DUF6604 domain-containing protein n=1 Tax=Pseudocercospora eumusae TaxID=321146 RepID=A0A139HR84_9PEZI|nr:hypothetical protein AC578_10294 [Pseudocercospora eumusae]
MPELPSDLNDLANLYQHLELEEPAPDLATAPRVATKTQTPSMKTPQEHELDSDEEKWFPIYCLFKDLMDIRLHVQGIWSQYNQGDLTFLTASKLTDSERHGGQTG